MATITRTWAMPSRWTFTIKPIAELLARLIPPGGDGWIDPFAGEHSPAAATNDLNPDRPTNHHLQAVEFLRLFPDGSVPGVLFDPPYSPRQVKEVYAQIGLPLSQVDTQSKFWSQCKDEIQRITQPGATVISFGWNSSGMGKRRGFELVELLLVPHGWMHNDTIVTVERKTSLF